MRYDLVVNTFVKDAIRSGKITIHYGGEMWRPMVEVRDVAKIYVAALEAPEEKVRGQILNVVYRNFRVSELALRVAKTLNEMGIGCQIASDYQYKGVRSYRVRGDKLSRILGITPQISVEDSVREIVAGIRKNHLMNFDHPRYYNIEWFKLLEEAQNIISVTSSVFKAEVAVA
jgi:nucleoside-diphosphate-sugar epimerase